MPVNRGIVSHFYENKSIFITGGDESLGKILIEKLLRSCSGIDTIYILLKPIPERTAEWLNIALFSELRAENSGIFSKIVVVDGDLNEPSLGLNKAVEETLINNVSMVFHCASVSKSNATLKQSLSNNVFGTLRLLKLCQRMKKIEAFVYVSTLYSTGYNQNIEERLPRIPCLNGINAYELMNEEELMKLIPNDSVNKWPDAHSFSQAITEVVINQQKGALSVSIVRPSIILSIIREPIPGWIDDYSNPTTIIINNAIGVTRCLFIPTEYAIDLVPSDFVVNLVICSAWKTAVEKSSETKIYNYGSEKCNPISCRRFLEECNVYSRSHPSRKILRYPYTIFTNYYYVYAIIMAIQNLLTYTYLLIAGDFTMFRLQQSADRVWKSFFPFLHRKFAINDYNVRELSNELSNNDKNHFLFDVESINWQRYIENYAKGIRIHLLKDDMGKLEEGQIHLNKLYWKEILIQVFLLMFLLASGYYLIDIMIPTLIHTYRNGIAAPCYNCRFTQPGPFFGCYWQS